jgi:hypothetical protein
VAAWAFGEERVGSGDSARYKPREIRIVQEMTWNGAACDVGEFGVTQVPPVQHDLEPFEPEALHNAGLVFEPVNSFSDARQAAEDQFREQARRRAKLDRLAQLFMRRLHNRYGLVYHPLWVMRYLYRGRVFQVVIDGFTGQVLYGKAPGNTLYRAGVLVLGMAIGAFLAVDVPAFILSALGDSDSSGIFMFAVGSFVTGLGAIAASYRAFRYGEQYEYRASAPAKIFGLDNPTEMLTNVKDVEEWINRLT